MGSGALPADGRGDRVALGYEPRVVLMAGPRERQRLLRYVPPVRQAAPGNHSGGVGDSGGLDTDLRAIYAVRMYDLSIVIVNTTWAAGLSPGARR